MKVFLFFAIFNLSFLAVEKETDTNQCSFLITSVKKSEPTEHEKKREPNIISKYIVSTELKNKTGKTWLFLKVPRYGASITDEIMPYVFLSSSRLPLVSKENDFLELAPERTLKADHHVFLIRNNPDGKPALYGYFVGSENVKEKQGEHNNFPSEWLIKNIPEKEGLKIAITFDDFIPHHNTDSILGRDYVKLWIGDLITNLVKLEK
jgi:hypothetical protein